MPTILKSIVWIIAVIVGLFIGYGVYTTLFKEDPKKQLDKIAMNIVGDNHTLFESVEKMKEVYPWAERDFVCVAEWPFDYIANVETTSRAGRESDRRLENTVMGTGAQIGVQEYKQMPRLVYVRFLAAWPPDFPESWKTHPKRPDLGKFCVPRMVLYENGEKKYDSERYIRGMNREYIEHIQEIAKMKDAPEEIVRIMSMVQEGESMSGVGAIANVLYENDQKYNAPHFKKNEVVWNNGIYKFYIDDTGKTTISNQKELLEMTEPGKRELPLSGLYVGDMKAMEKVDRVFGLKGYESLNRGFYFTKSPDNRTLVGRFEGIDETVDLLGVVLENEVVCIAQSDGNRIKPHKFVIPYDPEIPAIATLALGNTITKSHRSYSLKISPVTLDEAQTEKIKGNWKKLGEAPRNMKDHPYSWGYYMGGASPDKETESAVSSKPAKSAPAKARASENKTPKVSDTGRADATPAPASVVEPAPEPITSKQVIDGVPQYQFNGEAGWYSKKPKSFGIGNVEYGGLAGDENRMVFLGDDRGEVVHIEIDMGDVIGIKCEERGSGRDKYMNVYVYISKEKLADYDKHLTRTTLGGKPFDFIAFRIEEKISTMKRALENIHQKALSNR